MAKPESINEAAMETVSTPATNDNGALVALLDVDKVKSIRSNLGDRTYFESTEEATAYQQLEKHIAVAAEKTQEFFGLPISVADGLESASRIVCATVGVRDKGDSSAKPPIPARNGYKAIVIFKQPSYMDFINDESESARNFVQKLIEREATDVAFAGIRGAETVADLATVMAGLPDTVAGIVENSRASTGAGSSSFDIMWAEFRRAFLKPKYPKLDAVLPQKPEVAKAIKSKSYALANPVTKPIEENDYFAKIAALMCKMGEAWKGEDGEPSPLDTSDLQSWIDNRESNVIDFKVQEVSASDLAGLDF